MELLFFCREIGIFKVQKFASEKSYSAGIIQQYSAYIVNAADIGKYVYLSAVKGYILLAFKLLQELFLLLVTLLLIGIGF